MQLMKNIFYFIFLCFSIQLSYGNSMIGDNDANALEDEIAAADVLKLEPESMALRQMQSRRYDTADEKLLLDTAVAVFQDTGFIINEIEPITGTVLGSKARDAVEGDEVAGAIIIAVIFGVSIPVDRNQIMYASVVVSESDQVKNSTLVRINFSRLVWNTAGEISHAERLEEPEMYQTFFNHFTKGVFLDAHEI